MVLLVTLLMFPVMALSGEGGQPRPGPMPPIRAGLRITLLGLLSGVLAGLGYIVLLQQYSILYPTLVVVVAVLIVSMLVYGVVLPSIGRRIAVARINRMLARG